MVTKLSHTSIYVNDQDKAYDFYVNKLGFKVNADAKMENGFRWLMSIHPISQTSRLCFSPQHLKSMGLTRM